MNVMCRLLFKGEEEKTFPYKPGSLSFPLFYCDFTFTYGCSHHLVAFCSFPSVQSHHSLASHVAQFVMFIQMFMFLRNVLLEVTLPLNRRVIFPLLNVDVTQQIKEIQFSNISHTQFHHITVNGHICNC
jgi:hypothetical protein